MLNSRQRNVMKYSKPYQTKQYNKHKSGNTDSYWIICLLCGTIIYLYFIYLYFIGDIRILKQNIPAVTYQKIPFSSNFTNYKFDEDFISWMMKPNSICWNLKSQSIKHIFVVTVMFDYDSIAKLYVRQNRMYYALLNNYVYCEYSEYTPNIELFSNHEYVQQYDNRYQRWYKLFFIKYLLHNFNSNMKSLIWLDFDTIIINFNYTLNNNINIFNSHHSMYAQSDPFGILNSGVFVLKNNDWSISLMEFCTDYKIINIAHKNSPFRDQYAFAKYSREYSDLWTKNVKIIDGLQLKGNDFKQYKKHLFSWHIDGSKRKQTLLIECVLIKHEPIWFISMIYNITNKNIAFQQCLQKMYGNV
eukprot:139347_1